MNIFILSDSMKESAIYHTDKHIVKMPTETAQMLSFNYYHKELWDDKIPPQIMAFSKTHDLHPCTIWMRKSLSNWLWSAQFGLELYKEYQFRYNKPDKHLRARQVFEFALKNPPNLPDIGLTKFAEAMDDSFKTSTSTVENYRNYYIKGKAHLFKWTKRDKPYWIENANI